MSNITILNKSPLEITFIIQQILEEIEYNPAVYNFAVFVVNPNFYVETDPKSILRKWKDLFPNEPIYSGFKQRIMNSDMSDETKLYLQANFNMYLQTLYKIIIIKHMNQGIRTKVFSTN